MSSWFLLIVVTMVIVLFGSLTHALGHRFLATLLTHLMPFLISHCLCSPGKMWHQCNVMESTR